MMSIRLELSGGVIGLGHSIGDWKLVCQSAASRAGSNDQRVLVFLCFTMQLSLLTAQQLSPDILSQ
jgi:hypothetical protein